MSTLNLRHPFFVIVCVWFIITDPKLTNIFSELLLPTISMLLRSGRTWNYPVSALNLRQICFWSCLCLVYYYRPGIIQYFWWTPFSNDFYVIEISKDMELSNVRVKLQTDLFVAFVCVWFITDIRIHVVYFGLYRYIKMKTLPWSPYGCIWLLDGMQLAHI